MATPIERIPAVSTVQIEGCFANILLDDDLFRYARDNLEAKDFNLLGEARYALLWAAARTAAERNGGVLPEKARLTLIRTELTTISESAIRAGTMTESATRAAEDLLTWIFGQPRDSLNPGYYRGILQEMILERKVLNNLRRTTELARDVGRPVDLPEVLEQAAAQIREIGQVSKPALNLRDSWPDFQARLQQYRGREFLGLQTGLRQLDERTLGLRGLILLGAAPNVGKTALVLFLGINIIRESPDTCFLFISLEMDRAALQSRIYCNLAEMDWSTLVRGDRSLRGPEGPFFTPDQQARLQTADQWVARNGHRIRIHDRQSFGNRISAASILREMNALKVQSGCSRAFVVIDYLQLLPIPEKMRRVSDMDTDKYQLRVVQDIIAGMKANESALTSDAVMAISETRKPSVGRRRWGEDLADLMGSARLGYGADAVLLYRRMNEDEERFIEIYGAAGTTIEQMEREGIAPIMLELAKGRDGMRIGEWPVEYLFNRSMFRDIEPRPGPQLGTVQSLRRRPSPPNLNSEMRTFDPS